jgi:hypothetical protein
MAEVFDAALTGVRAGIQAAWESREPEPAPWAICVGGLIQDDSGIESTDLDWMRDNGPADRDEVEGSWRVLNRAVHEGHTGWAYELRVVTETLEQLYKDENTDEEARVWNE